ncbi:MAG: AAA family ATPase [Actinomycetota bacterium]|nr:AAA family ATPase [Actinomycetota bacterium]
MKSPRITLCGRLSVVWDEEELEDRIPGRQGRLLFAFLTLNRSRPVRRDELVEALWADEGLPRGGETLLAPPLSRLRKALGPGRIEGRSEISLVPGEDPWIDWEVAQASLDEAQDFLAGGNAAAAFDRSLDAGRIFSGGLLPGLEARWIDDHRVLLEEFRLKSLELVARAGSHLGSSEQSKAERAARQAVEASPFRESARAALIEVMEAQGNVAEALRAYEELRVLLRDELGTFPAPELSAIHDRLLNAHEKAPAPAAPGATGRRPGTGGAKPGEIGRLIDPRIDQIGLVGRDRILGKLKEELDLAVEGSLRIALLAGDGGIGKTRIAAELAIAREDVTVLYGRSEPDEVRPFRIWSGLLRSALRQAEDIELDEIVGGDGPTLARILPELVKRMELPPPGPPGDLESERRALFGAVLRLIGRLTAIKPMLIILDDLHWADRSTLMLLTSLAGDNPPRGVFALGIYRNTELPADSLLPETLVNLQRRLPTVKLEVGALGTGEVSRLVGDRVEPGLAAALHDQTGGNPFLIEQIVRHLEETGEKDPEAVPAEVREIVAQRVSRLPGGGDELLRRASLIGRDFDLAILERTTPAGEDEVIRLLDAAVDAGLLDESTTVPGRYSFVHALLRSTLMEHLSLTRRSTVHRDIGEAIEQLSQNDPDRRLGELAWHFSHAGPSEADRAVHYATRAAEQAEGRLAYDEAVGFYTAAIRACRSDQPVDNGLLAKLLLSQAEAKWKNGMLREAGDTFIEAAEAARLSGLPELLARAALGTVWGGWDAFDSDIGDQLRLFEEALELLADEDSVLRAQLMVGYAQMLFYGAGKSALAHELAIKAQEMIKRFDDPRAEFMVLAGTAFVRWEPGNRDLRLAASDRLVEIAEGLPEKELLAQALAWRSLAKLNLGRRAEADADRARHQAMSVTLPQVRMNAAALKAVDCFISGDWQRGERLTAELLGQGIPRAASLLLEDTLRFMVRAQQGRLHEHLDRLEELAPAKAPWNTWPAWRLGLMLARVQGGEADEVREELSGLARTNLDDVEEPNASFLAFCAVGNLLTGELEDRAGAGLLVELMEPWSGEWVIIGRIGSTLGPVDLHLGEMYLLTGDERSATTALERSLVTCEEMRSAPYLARTQLALAEALHRLGDPDGPERGYELREAGKLTALELGMQPALRRFRRS